MGNAVTSRRAVLLVGAAAAAGVLTACSDEAPPEPPTTGAEPSADPESTGPSPEESTEEASADGEDEYTTVVATSAVRALSVYGEPEDLDSAEGGGEQERVLDRADEISGDLVLLALAAGRSWVHVQLPVRPNGTTGWVRTRDVRLSQHRYAIDITLGGHELVLTEGSREVLRTDIGVGRTDRPTPGGDYYTKELLRPPDPNGIYGPYAYGLSGYSNVLTEFLGGEAIIGIHGTNEPGLVGTDVSSGCIRMPNETIIRLVEEIALPLGVPVVIRE